jgi:hypothetical protein
MLIFTLYSTVSRTLEYINPPKDDAIVIKTCEKAIKEQNLKTSLWADPLYYLINHHTRGCLVSKQYLAYFIVLWSQASISVHE